MAFLLKSNIEVENEDINFEYLTSLGPATIEVANYVNKLLELGYDMSSTEFNAVKTYHKDLVDSGQWDNHLEIAPLIGNTIDQVCVKLKYKNNQSCTKINGIDDTFVDGYGLSIIPRASTNPKALNIDFTVQEVFDSGGGGIISYYKSSGTFPAGNYKAILAAAGGIGDVYSTADSITNRFLNSTFVSNSIGDGGFIYASKYVITGGQVVSRRSFKDGTIFSQSNTPTTITSITNPTQGHYIGATNNGGTSIQGFEGKIRFVAIHNGLISDSAMSDVNTITQTLITSLGKTII